MADTKRSPLPLFTDVGKRAKDILQKGFTAGHMLFVSFVTSGGATVSTSSIMADGAVVGTISTSFKGGGAKTDLSTTTLNQLSAETTYENLFPGLKISLSTSFPGAHNLGKAQLVYQHESAAVSATMKGWRIRPALECTANFGCDHLCLGSLVAYNTQEKALLATAGLGYSSPRTSAALLYNPVGERSMIGCCSHEINSNAVWAMQVDYWLKERVTSAMVGGFYKLDPLTTVKARVKSCGTMTVVLEYEPKPLVTFGLTTEFNCRNLKEKRPNIGLSLSVLSV